MSLPTTPWPYLLCLATMLPACGQPSSSSACMAVGCSNTLVVHVPGLLEEMKGRTTVKLRFCLSGDCQDLIWKPLDTEQSCVLLSRTGVFSYIQCQISAKDPRDLRLRVILQPTSVVDTQPKTIVLSVTDGDGVMVTHRQTSFSFLASMPNGEDCPPVCYNATATLRND
jgi:hypothetical protein